MLVSVQRRVAPQLNFCTTQCDDYNDNLAGVLGLPNFVQFSPRIPFVSPHLLLILFKFASTSPFRCSRGSIPNRVIRVLRPQAKKASPSSTGLFGSPPIIDELLVDGNTQSKARGARRHATSSRGPTSQFEADTAQRIRTFPSQRITRHGSILTQRCTILNRNCAAAATRSPCSHPCPGPRGEVSFDDCDVNQRILRTQTPIEPIRWWVIKCEQRLGDGPLSTNQLQ